MEKSFVKITDTGNGFTVSGFSSGSEMLCFLCAFIIHLLCLGFSFEALGDILNTADDLYQDSIRTGKRL